MAREDALIDGNKRLALAATIAFLELNGRRLTMSNDEAYEFVMSVPEAWLTSAPSPTRSDARPSSDGRGGRLSSGRPQDGVSSTDRAGRLRVRPGPVLLDGMTLIKRIAQQAKAIRFVLERGMTTAEYAVGTIAAVAFAAVLYKVVQSDAVSTALSTIVTSALHAL